MNNLDGLKARMNALGGNAESRLINDKLKTLKKAIDLSYQSEEIVREGQTMRALINSNKLKMDYDDKILSIPHESQMKVGDIFYWKRARSNWIVYLQQYTEDAYFRGQIRKAEHTIKWKDEFGTVHETAAAVRGPVETKIRSQMKSGLSFDEPNYTLNIIIPNTEHTKALTRYVKFMLEDTAWEITSSDAISEKGVIELTAIESYKNREEDTNEIVGGKIQDTMDVNCSLDKIERLEVGTAVDLWADITINGNRSSELNGNTIFQVQEGFAEIEGGKLVPKSTGILRVTMAVPKKGYYKDFEFLVEGILDDSMKIVEFDILGDERVKSYGTTTYTIAKYVNGVKVSPTGMWSLKNNKELFTIESTDRESIAFRWVSGRSGSVELMYKDGEDVKTKTIYVKGLL